MQINIKIELSTPTAQATSCGCLKKNNLPTELSKVAAFADSKEINGSNGGNKKSSDEVEEAKKHLQETINLLKTNS